MKLIYIIEDGSGNKKIGITGDIKKRVAQLKTAVSTGIVSVMVSDFRENASSIEKQLHEANKAYRLNGEWFSEVIDFGDIEFSYSKIKTTAIIEREAIESLPEAAYINWYIKNLGNLCGLTAVAIKVLMNLVSKTNLQSELSLPRGIREKIGKELGGVSLGVINNAITELVKKEILSRVGSQGSGVYSLNPDFFARGKWRDIYYKRKDFKLTITYKDDGGEGKREVITEQIGADIIQMPTQNLAE